MHRNQLFRRLSAAALPQLAPAMQHPPCRAHLQLFKQIQRLEMRNIRSGAYRRAATCEKLNPLSQ
jgi:hypothetical protein